MMTYASVCSGIEAPSCAWRPLGWRPLWFSEIEPFCCALLEQRHPGIPNLGDMTRIQNAERPDVLVGGTPCQSFSVAGLRGGMADPRGNLALVFLGIVDRLRPRWVVWENVPGVLSSNGGKDFGAFLGGLGECGYGFAYRVLDAQYFDLAQRRERVFVVAHFDWRRAAAVLFERSSLRGDSPPSREAGERVTASLTRGADSGGKGGYAGRRREDDVNLIAPALRGSGVGTERIGDTRGQDCCIIAPTCSPALKARDGKGPSSDGDGAPLIVHALRREGHDASEDGTGRGTPIIPILEATDRQGNKTACGHGIGRDGDPMFTLQSRTQHAIAFDTTQITSKTNRSNPQPGDPCHTLAKGAHAPAISNRFGVRRLMPIECERLQGFEDDHTLITYRGKPAKDAPRYRAIGNSIAVPVLKWIGERIEAVEAITHA